MDITPIYELRSRLRAAMIAGTNLLAEDFRLKRAIESFTPLEKAAPVFGKIGTLCRAMLEPAQEKREELLLEAVSLLDAVICTQGAVAVQGELEPLAVGNTGAVVVNAPYSVLKTLVDALTSSGNGHYSYVVEMHQKHPELFKDYRVKPAMVRALGASYAELAGMVEKWLRNEGSEIIPLLEHGFDPKGKREMVRRVQAIEAIAGAEANDFYIAQLPEAEKEVRQALIYALRHNPDNAGLLCDLIVKERGNLKKTACYALADMEVPEAEEYFRKLVEKKPKETMEYLYLSECAWASRLIAEQMEGQLKFWTENVRVKEAEESAKARQELLAAAVKALPGKWGPEICRIWKKLIAVRDKIEAWTGQQKINLNFYFRNIGNKASLRTILAEELKETLVIHPDKELMELAVSLYENRDDKSRFVYFPAAFYAKLMSKENCSDWLEEQLFTDNLLGRQKRREVYSLLPGALNGLEFDTKKGYVLQIGMAGRMDNALECYTYPIAQDITGRISDLFMQCEDEKVDRMLTRCIDPENKAYCRKLEPYLYRRALTVQNGRQYFGALCLCGCKRCDGLMESCLKKQTKVYQSEIHCWFALLPGDGEEKAKEAVRVLSLIKNGKIKVQFWNEESYLNMVEELRLKG